GSDRAVERVDQLHQPLQAGDGGADHEGRSGRSVHGRRAQGDREGTEEAGAREEEAREGSGQGRAAAGARGTGKDGRQVMRLVLTMGLPAALGGLALGEEEGEKRRGGGRVMKLEATVVEGHVHKPQAFYL